jgi:chemotaxis-related protein WspB
MLLLTFRVAQDLYAVDATRVVEIVPRVDPRPIPRTPDFFVGLFGYRGRVVPAIDLSLLLGKAPAPGRLSTRVILVEARKSQVGRHPSQPAGEPLLLGLIVEQVNEVVRVDDARIAFPSMRLEGAPYLGAMVRVDPDARSLAQLIEVDSVLPGSLRDALFGGWEKTDEIDARDRRGSDRANKPSLDETPRSEVPQGAVAR